MQPDGTHQKPAGSLLRRLFFIGETSLVGSFAVIFGLYQLNRHPRAGEILPGEIFYFIFMGSFLALLILGFFLWRMDRALAAIGWASALGLLILGSLSG